MSAAGGPRMVCGHGHPCWDTLFDWRLLSAMIMKANSTNLPIAKEAIQKKIAKVEANILTIHIDPDIIASLRELGMVLKSLLIRVQVK
eukprot:scaffold260004_cov88-Attheya_sp.AAC.4